MPIKTKPVADPAGQLWAKFDSALRAFEPRHTPLQDVVIVVHGTFANPPRGRGAPSLWWETRGSFSKALDAALERHGSAARCYRAFDHRRPHGEWSSWTGWSGANSEVERRRAAYELAAYVRALQRNDDIGRINIVAHSHGGNVARRALRYLDFPWRKLGVVVCLGTPFLHFADTAAWRRWVSRIHWPMLIVLAAIVAAIVRWFQHADTFTLLSIVGFAAGAVILIGRYAWTSEGCSKDAPAFGFRFAGDEAILLMQSCADLASEPHLYVRDMLGGAAEPRDLKRREGPRPFDTWFDRLFEGRSPVWRLTWNGFARVSNVWNGPICRVAERMTSACYRLPLLGYVASLGLMVFFKPYRPPLRPFLLSRMPRLRSLFFHSFEDYGEQARKDSLRSGEKRTGLDSGDRGASLTQSLDQALGALPFSPRNVEPLAAFAALLVYLLFYPLDLLLGLPTWLGNVMTRFAILLGARAAASSAPGMDILASAFKSARTGRIPPDVHDVVVPEAIARDIEHRLSATDRIDFAALRATLDPAKRASLFESVGRVFTDVGLMHAQYYQDPRIIEAVAEVISREAIPSWSATPSASSEARPD